MTVAPLRSCGASRDAWRVHDQMVELVGRMSALHEQRQAARTGLDTRILTNQIEATDWQIDRLVYELYGLTADEVRIVEEATFKA